MSRNHSNPLTRPTLPLRLPLRNRQSREANAVPGMRPHSSLWRGVRITAVCVVLLLLGAAGLRGYMAYTAYRGASEQVAELERLSEEIGSVPASTDLARVEAEFDDLRLELDRLDRATALPFGTGRLVEHVPWIGPRYEAGRQLVLVGQLLADAGVSGAQIGRRTLAAFEQTGIRSDWSQSSETWLDTVVAREPELDQIVAQIERVRAIRAGMDDKYLPARFHPKVAELDRVLGRVEVGLLTSNDLPTIARALGSERPVRYLVLFQNPAELRPAGGFPGTSALVTVSRGQLEGYEFFDSHRLTQDYMAQRSEKLPLPWPIQQYFPQDGFLLHDATWFADFPRSGAQVMAMYAETDWPPIDGVIAVQPPVVSDLLRVTGPVTVTVRGEEITVTADNVYQELERQQRLWRDGTTHKEMLSSIGAMMIDRIIAGESAQLRSLGSALSAAADRRDVQVYAEDRAVQQTLDARHWTGRLVPDQDVATFALTFANVAINKASLMMDPNVSLTFGAEQDGMRSVRAVVEMRNTGSNDDDPFYSGFQRWWVDVTLPAGSVLGTTLPNPLPDPDASSGGGYLVEIFPGQTGRIELEFSMPVEETLLLRRQPGVSTVGVDLQVDDCVRPAHVELTADALVTLTQLCTAP